MFTKNTATALILIATLSAAAPAALSKDASHDKSTGKASWYGAELHGHKTASGQRYDMHKMTAAHRTLPFGTRVKVLNHKTGKSCIVEINDRGPHRPNRIIDVSHAAAKELGIFPGGEGMVTLTIVGKEKPVPAIAAKPADAVIKPSTEDIAEINEPQQIAQRPYPLIE